MTKLLSCSCGRATPATKENFVARDTLAENYAKGEGMKIYSFLFDCECKSTIHLNTGKDAKKFDEIVNGARGKILKF